MNSTTRSRRGRLRWLVVASCVPIIGLLIGGVLIAAREFSAGSRLKAKVSELKQAGLPFDNQSFDQWYRWRTHSEGAVAWVEVLEIVSASSELGAVDRLPIVGQGQELAELDPNAEWRDVARVKEYLTEMKGMIQKTHQLKQWPTPVQLPVEFQGVGTLLPHFQQARSVSRLLQLDFEYAFFHKEFDRAMQDLLSIGTVSKAIDNELCLVTDLIANAILQSQYHEIQRSLVTDTWPQEKLTELRQTLNTFRYNPIKWKNLFINERALFSEDVASGDLSRVTDRAQPSLVPLLNTGRLRIFEAYDDLIEAGNGELAAVKSASKLASERFRRREDTLDVGGGNAWIAALNPHAEAMAKAFENEENNRRLTVTAIALRQYKHLQGKWPKRLGELAKVDLVPSDYSTVHRGEFGFEVADDVAYLWGSDMSNDAPVKSERPNIGTETQYGAVTLVKLR